jgi:hypothetical protein
MMSIKMGNPTNLVVYPVQQTKRGSRGTKTKAGLFASLQNCRPAWELGPLTWDSPANEESGLP